MLNFYLLCYAAVLIKFTYYAQKLCSRTRIVLSLLSLFSYIQIPMNKSLLIADNLERLFIRVYSTYSQIMTVQLEYINHLLKIFKNNIISYYAGIMLSVTYYAQNYTGMIDWSLVFDVSELIHFFMI